MNLKHLSEEILSLAEDLDGFLTLNSHLSERTTERIKIHLIKMDILIKQMLLKTEEEFK